MHILIQSNRAIMCLFLLSFSPLGFASEYGQPLRLYSGPPGSLGAPRVEPRAGSTDDGMWTSVAGGIGRPFAFDTFWLGAARSYATPGQEYWGSIDNAYLHGANSAPPSQETRNLFAAFRTGAWFGNETGAIDSCVEQQILQARIWLLEGTYADVNSLPDRLRRAYTDPANQSLVEEITAMGGIWRPESENVRVLNLWENYALNPTTGEYEFSGDRYSQLIMIPAPGAALLAMLGLGTTIWCRRRF